MRTLGLLLAAVLILSVPAPAQAAKSGRECYSGSDTSLIVKGRLGCKKGIQLRDATIEPAAVAIEEGRRKFRAKGFRCTVLSVKNFAYVCRDQRPQRSFTVRL